jgi:O-antigen/teichoic acid export membrane protein
MKSSLERTVVKNAGANVFRLAGAAIVALLLPPFLVRTLSKEIYGTWALLLQLTMYVGYLDFGIQTAVARFVAHADELNDFEQRDGIVSTAFVMLTAAAVLGSAIIVLLSWKLPNVFHQMPAGLHRPAQIALVLMGVSLALGLPVTVLSSLFIGMQRNEIPAAVAIGNKFVMALLVTAVVLKHWGLVAMSAAMAVANLLSYCGAFVAWKARAARVRIELSLASKLYARQIGLYSGPLFVWMFGMLLVSWLDMSIVGIFDYREISYYAIAATLTNFVAQAHGALCAALLPASAVLGARGDTCRLGHVLVLSTRYGMLILLATALPLMVGGQFAIRWWAGADYAEHSTAIMKILLLANVVRLCALPYATLLLGTGQQKKVILSPLAEGVTNLIASLVGAYYLGAIGVAIGTLIGSFVSIGFHLFYNMPRTVAIDIDRLQLIRDGLLRPLICGLPFVAFFFLRLATPIPPDTQASLIATATFGAVLLLWKYGLLGPERQRLSNALRLHRAAP